MFYAEKPMDPPPPFPPLVSSPFRTYGGSPLPNGLDGPGAQYPSDPSRLLKPYAFPLAASGFSQPDAEQSRAPVLNICTWFGEKTFLSDGSAEDTSTSPFKRLETLTGQYEFNGSQVYIKLFHGSEMVFRGTRTVYFAACEVGPSQRFYLGVTTFQVKKSLFKLSVGVQENSGEMEVKLLEGEEKVLQKVTLPIKE